MDDSDIITLDSPEVSMDQSAGAETAEDPLSNVNDAGKNIEDNVDVSLGEDPLDISSEERAKLLVMSEDACGGSEKEDNKPPEEKPPPKIGSIRIKQHGLFIDSPGIQNGPRVRLNVQENKTDTRKEVNSISEAKRKIETKEKSGKNLPNGNISASEDSCIEIEDSSSSKEEEEADFQETDKEDNKSKKDKSSNSDSSDSDSDKEDKSGSDSSSDSESGDSALEEKDWEERNIVTYSKKEDKYYQKHRDSFIKKLELKAPLCTSCFEQINYLSKKEVYTHKALGVLSCRRCYKTYGDGKFVKDDEGFDEYCRWCANGGDLLLCEVDGCQNGFCKKCVKRNLGRTEENEAEEADEWSCYQCSMKPLTEVRAIHRAILEKIRADDAKKNRRSRLEDKKKDSPDKFAVLREKRKQCEIINKKKKKEDENKKSDSRSKAMKQRKASDKGKVAAKELPLKSCFSSIEDMLNQCQSQVEKLKNKWLESLDESLNQNSRKDRDKKFSSRFFTLTQTMVTNFDVLGRQIKEESGILLSDTDGDRNKNNKESIEEDEIGVDDSINSENQSESERASSKDGKRSERIKTKEINKKNIKNNESKTKGKNKNTQYEGDKSEEEADEGRGERNQESKGEKKSRKYGKKKMKGQSEEDADESGGEKNNSKGSDMSHVNETKKDACNSKTKIHQELDKEDQVDGKTKKKRKRSVEKKEGNDTAEETRKSKRTRTVSGSDQEDANSSTDFSRKTRGSSSKVHEKKCFEKETPEKVDNDNKPIGEMSDTFAAIEDKDSVDDSHHVLVNELLDKLESEEESKILEEDGEKISPEKSVGQDQETNKKALDSLLFSDHTSGEEKEPRKLADEENKELTDKEMENPSDNEEVESEKRKCADSRKTMGKKKEVSQGEEIRDKKGKKAKRNDRSGEESNFSDDGNDTDTEGSDSDDNITTAKKKLKSKWERDKMKKSKEKNENGSDSETCERNLVKRRRSGISEGRKGGKHGQKKQKNVKLTKEQQLEGKVLVNLRVLTKTIINEVTNNGFIDVQKHADLIDEVNNQMEEKHSSADSDAVIDKLLKFNAKKKTRAKKSSDEMEEEGTADSDASGSKLNKSGSASEGESGSGRPVDKDGISLKKRKLGKSTKTAAQKNQHKRKKNGLLDVHVSDDKESEEDGKSGSEEKFKESPGKDGPNNKSKKELLNSSEEDDSGSETSGHKDIADKEDKKEAEKAKKRYEKRKAKLADKEDSKDEGSEKGTSKKGHDKRGYVSLKFSSDESDVEDKRSSKGAKKKGKKEQDSDDGSESSDFETHRKKRMYIDSDSDGGKRSRKKKTKVFESSEENKNRSSSEDSSAPKTKKKGNKSRKRISKRSSSSSAEAGDKDEESPNKKKRPRRIIKDEDLKQATKDATQTESTRRARVEERQKLYNKIFVADGQDKETEDTAVVLDFDPESKKELVVIDRKVSANLKPHQVTGVKFMWDATVESIERLRDGDKGGGCILAHCMGLGKTLQIIALVHTLLTNRRTSDSIKTILVCCPVNTILNWVAEFKLWLKRKLSFDVTELITAKNLWDKAYRLDEWRKEGGVVIIGYDMYRNLSNAKNKKYKATMRTIFQESLVDPGPDMIVCDEGHILRNEATALSTCVSNIKTRRRIVLTGTPLQNNLKEYHCMIQFVKPNLLGTRKEFMNRFVNPITNGTCAQAGPADVRRMKRRAHVLHNLLEGCVQRYDYSILKPFLSPKFEYVISVQMSALQCKLYNYYLDNLAQGGPDRQGGSGLFVDFSHLSRIWTHPRVLELALKRRIFLDDLEQECEEMENFICDDTTSEDSDEKSSKKKGKKGKKKEEQKGEESKNGEENKNGMFVLDGSAGGLTASGSVKSDWWRKFLEEIGGPDYDEDEILDSVDVSGKLCLLFEILRECCSIGDKLLVFSQSLLSLDTIEIFLEMLDDGRVELLAQENDLPLPYNKWKKDRDYIRLDGSTGAEIRKDMCKEFNDDNNQRLRLFLISTKAGGIGINLTGANRVIIFDQSWNPSNDTQSIFRVYRFGQKKPVYIYRFVAQGTMEEKIYSRQVTKLSTSLRVVDEHQIQRHFNMAELAELYQFNPSDESVREITKVPEDRLLAELIIRNKKWIVTYHEHDSLLENQEEEQLNEEERKAAWEDYENEKKGVVPMTAINVVSSGNVVVGGRSSTFNLSEIINVAHATAGTTDPLSLQFRIIGAVRQWRSSAASRLQQIEVLRKNLLQNIVSSATGSSDVNQRVVQALAAEVNQLKVGIGQASQFIMTNTPNLNRS